MQIPLNEAAAGPFTIEPAMYAVVTIGANGVIVNMDAPLDRQAAAGAP